MLDKVNAGFVYALECFKKDGSLKWIEHFHNLLPDEGRDYIINAAMNGASQFSTWYIGLYTAGWTPATSDTMVTLIANAAETSNYSGGARKELTPDALAAGLFSNLSTPAEFDFTSETTVRGGFISSNSVIGNSSGVLLSAGLLQSPRTIANGETLKVTAGWSLTTA